NRATHDEPGLVVIGRRTEDEGGFVIRCRASGGQIEMQPDEAAGVWNIAFCHFGSRYQASAAPKSISACTLLLLMPPSSCDSRYSSARTGSMMMQSRSTRISTMDSRSTFKVFIMDDGSRTAALFPHF